ncbi:amino acid permease-domain-containing protein [Phellopilus nigrolimitatus]|nr:amino acid permease-domain-containing protein [Phellopilus nigrolimitatus]
MSLMEKANATVNSAQAQIEEEDVRLRQLGIRRELRKEFTNFSTLSFAIGIMGMAATVAATFNTPILLGGRAVAIWTWLLGLVGCLAIAVSVAELVSAYPTAGGLYTSTAFVVPPRYRASVTFVNAWLTLLGQCTGQASVSFALSQMIFAAVTIGTDGRFTASTGQTLGVYIGVTVALGILNSMPMKLLHRVSFLYSTGKLASSQSVWTGVSYVSSIFSWPFLTFLQIADNSGWNNKGFAFLLGLLCVQYVMTDYDAVAHISEEVKNAAVAAPVAIVLGGTHSICISRQKWVDTKDPLNLHVGIYAISRDNAIPDRRLFCRVSSRTGTPVNAAILTVIVVMLLGLLSLVSLIAINAVFSANAVALDLSYIVPITAKVYIAFQKDPGVRFTPGPFYTGKWSIVINIYAIICVLIMPQVFPVTAATMNYTSPILVVVCGLSWIWYKVYWHRHYRGPASVLVGSTPVTVSNDSSSEEKDEKAWAVSAIVEN